ncbi:MAG: DUF58 domain-containing protein [Verrucomicrobiota bacterium]
MVRILQQPTLSFGSFSQVYEFDLPPGPANPRERILDFFQGRQVRGLKLRTGEVQFERGSRWRSLLLPNELNLLQQGLINVVADPARTVVRCEYHCEPSLFCTLRFGPSQLHKEVRLLEAFLAGTAPAPRKTVKSASVLTVRPVFKLLYRLYRLFSWMHYHASRRLSTAGMLVLCAMVAAGAMGVDTDSTVTYQAFAPLFFLLAVSMLCSLFFRAKFSATRLLPQFGTVGLPFTYTVRARNLTSKTQAGLMLLENLADPRPSFDDWFAAQLADERRVRSFKFNQRTNRAFHRAMVKEANLPPLAPGGEAETQVSLVPLRRGSLRFTGFTFARPDPIGLFRSFIRVAMVQTVLVLPRRYPIPRLALPGTEKYQEGGVAMAANIGRSDEFVSLRDYRRGDPLRHIHWRSWAKIGKPIVKEFEDDYFTRHALVLDTFTDDPRSPVFEEAVSVAASFACTIPTQESLLDLLFIGPRAFCFTSGRGLAHADQMLEVLASVEAIPGQSFRTLEQLVIEHSASVTGCIFVLLTWDDARKELVRKLKVLGVPVLVIVMAEADSEAVLAPGPMMDEPERFHVLEVGRVEEGLARLK